MPQKDDRYNLTLKNFIKISLIFFFFNNFKKNIELNCYIFYAEIHK